MLRTAALAASTAKRSVRSLALSVHFKHPDLGMEDYEVLSRASAFLLQVDPEEESDGPYSYLSKSEKERERRIHKQKYSPEPAGGPPRDPKDLSWLEFCPGRHRPLVHVLTSSHVLSPWLWKQYYPQPWLNVVTQEHVRYSVDVFDNSADSKTTKREPLATFALNPYPIHHPSEMDVAIIHLKQEDSALKNMRSLGVEMMHLRKDDNLFDKGDEVVFDGFELAEEHYAHMEKMNNDLDENEDKESSQEDTRVFIPYIETGNLIFASASRFLSSTEKPLPEGLCGGPVIDRDNRICGIVEGIIPSDHENKEMVGAASFIPSFRLREFVDHAERMMLQKILPEHVFQKVVNLKEGKPLHHNTSIDLTSDDGNQQLSNEDATTLNEAFDSAIKGVKKSNNPDQVKAILGTIEREQQEVIDMIEREGGDLDEIIAKVRTRTRQRQREIFEEVENDSIQEAEIVSEIEGTSDEKPSKQ
mmetsp:Transcript_4609/g.6770  ORF Transcript_4609/g.6770 Transcript_4609/m.6770 type:complete len:473 (-) Transcript_4609:11-1429(-)